MQDTIMQLAEKSPETLLILGTDASGKNHVANFIVGMLEKSGHKVEKREGWFSKKESDAVSSEDKGLVDLLKEDVFIAVFPLIKHIIPMLSVFLIRNDLRRFKKTNKKVLVISHTAIRILVFYLGHVYSCERDIRIPGVLRKTLKSVIPATGAKTIVLDIDDRIRKSRVAARMLKGKADNFDRYMAKDGVRSERIESFMVWIAEKYLDAEKIENNDLDDSELVAEINRAFLKFRQG